jgi:hypothetical protein
MLDQSNNLKHNLYEISFLILNELQSIRRRNQNSLGFLPIIENDFSARIKTIRELIKPFVLKCLIHDESEDQVSQFTKKDKLLFNPESIKLLSEDIPWAVALEQNHTLKDSIPVKKGRGKSISVKGSGLEYEKGERLIKKIEHLSETGNGQILKQIPWHLLLTYENGTESCADDSQ